MSSQPLHAPINTLLTRLAGALSLIVAIAPVTAYWVYANNSITEQLNHAMHLEVLALEKFITAQPTYWDLAPDRLRTDFERYTDPGNSYRITNKDGETVFKSGAVRAGPTLSLTQTLYSFGQPVGELEASKSVAREALVGLILLSISLGLAWLIWGPLRRLPLRALASAEKALVTREEYQRALLDNFPFMVWLRDKNNRLLAANAKYFEATASSGPADQADMNGLAVGVAIPQEALRADDVSFLEAGSAERIEVWTETLKPRRCFEIYKSPVSLNDELIGSVGYARDITESKMIEEQLRISATAFESQEGMFITDSKNIILRVNRAFTEITGYTAAEALGKTPQLLHSGRHGAEFYAAMWQSLEESGAWQGEIWNRRRNGEVYPEWLSITSVRDGEGNVSHYVATLSDITLRKAAEDEIKHLAFYDPLTRLPNRRLLLDRLKQALASSARRGREGALFFIDLDNFKGLNDTLGHDMGDLLLQQVASRLSTCVREGDTVARFGGDEFVIMLEGLSRQSREAAAQIEVIGEKILTLLNQPYLLAGHEYHSTASIGIATFTAHQDSLDELLKRADLAMYRAKAEGRNALRFFDPEMQAVAISRASLESDLRQGLQKEQFLLHFQPQVDRAGRVTGAEALVRWQHPQRGMVSPVEFIPLAEETGLILPLGQWILETACRQLFAWSANASTEHLTLAVNVSVRQFRQPEFVEQVMTVLARTRAKPQKLKLELTESLMMTNVEDIIEKMSALRENGVTFSLDDFGTGYSSLAYLKRLPLDQLKIDQSFVRDVFSDINDAAIAQTIIALGQTMGLSVIAEGVETAAQQDFLSRLGCQAYQGYLYSRPLPAAAFDEFVKRA